MSLSANEEALAERYLLGEATAEEQSKIEERFFADDVYFQEMCAVEDGLIDDYVCDRLSASDNARFEECLQTSADWERAVQFARTLARVARSTGHGAADGQRQPAVVAITPSGWRFPRFWPAYGAIAVASAAIVTGGWLLLETNRVRTELGELRRESVQWTRQEHDLVSALDAQRARSEDLAAQLRAERERVAAVEERLQALPPARPLVSFVLLPGRQRNVSPETATPPLVVPNGTDVRLQLDVPYGDASAAYRAILLSAANEQVWSEDVGAAAGGPRLAVVLRVPSQVLRPGRYELHLQQANRAGQFSPFGTYSFTVVRP